MFHNLIKRTIDIFAGFFLFILFLPIWILIPILIKLDSKGPLFYCPERVGKGGKNFNMFKFRSMKMLTDKNGEPAHAVEYWKQNKDLYERYKKSGWKLEIKDDPRITRIGRMLRQTSIDEMPQVLNILKGDMSLVGPRAYVQPEIEDAKKRYGKKIFPLIDMSLTTKPGLTGPWQVSGRNDIPWNKRVKMDAEYAQRRSILEDLLIILRTPFVMISKW